jgi:hypothetical protein
MNAAFNNWDEKADSANSNEKFDPTFSRHDDRGYPSVDEVSAVTGERGGPTSHDEQIRVAHAAAAAAAQQQHQQQITSATPHSQTQILHPEYEKKSPPGEYRDVDAMTASEAKASRRVSNTKRAAQNRSAQRAFRQRKDKYVKELESRAAEVEHLKQTIEELRHDNLQLRNYTLALQSRVIELSPGSAQTVVQGSTGTNLPVTESTIIPPPPSSVFNVDNK